MQFLRKLTWFTNFRCAALLLFWPKRPSSSTFLVFSCGLVIYFFHNHAFHVFSNLFCKKCAKINVFFSFCFGRVSVRISTAIPAKADLVDQFLRRNTAFFLEKTANFSDFCHAFVWPGYTLLS